MRPTNASAGRDDPLQDLVVHLKCMQTPTPSASAAEALADAAMRQALGSASFSKILLSFHSNFGFRLETLGEQIPTAECLSMLRLEVFGTRGINCASWKKGASVRTASGTCFATVEPRP